MGLMPWQYLQCDMNWILKDIFPPDLVICDLKETDDIWAITLPYCDNEKYVRFLVKMWNILDRHITDQMRISYTDPDR